MTNRTYPGWRPNALGLGTGLMLIVAAASFSSRSLAETLPAVRNIEISNSAFKPNDVTVAPGTRIAWINRDEMPHTVTARDKSFASKGLDSDDKFEHTFSQEGDFAYYCTVHPYMTGTIHVRK